MKQDVVAPSVGESITEVSILQWAKEDGEQVAEGDLLLEIESDKATVEVVAESAGVLNILKSAGETVPVGTVVGNIDTDKKGAVKSQAAPSSSPSSSTNGQSDAPAGPSVRKTAHEHDINLNEVSGTGKNGRVTQGDVLSYLDKAKTAKSTPPFQKAAAKEGERRVKMTGLRSRIAERLVQAQQAAAILTTFNEVDLTEVMAVRKKYKEKFKEKHGVSLGFMSFFTRAAVEALKEIPGVNAFIDGPEIVYHDYCNVGIAVGTEKGLVVPVLKNAEKMGFVDIEKGIVAMAEKARAGKLSIDDLTGGTFTISNGGVYGSMLSTPILNPPQSGILGMHNIIQRPVAIDGKVEIRPMMYLALSYDHRLIDGKEAVTFLIHVKKSLENPSSLNLDFV